jgi:hypothetical protein
MQHAFGSGISRASTTVPSRELKRVRNTHRHTDTKMQFRARRALTAMEKFWPRRLTAMEKFWPPFFLKFTTITLFCRAKRTREKLDLKTQFLRCSARQKGNHFSNFKEYIRSKNTNDPRFRKLKHERATIYSLWNTQDIWNGFSQGT